MIDNNKEYIRLLSELIQCPCEENDDNIIYEIIDASAVFNCVDRITCSNEKYIQHELDWYLSQDTNIKGHVGIENNAIWKHVASDAGFVNSNYGWCIFSPWNYSQYDNVIERLKKDKNTKAAVMIYSRPSIHVEAYDNKHASHDMTCTIYVSVYIRNGKLIYIVHMRSNDIWYGLRNDLAWHQYVVHKMCQDLGMSIDKCEIHWHADSLHLYKRNEQDINDMLAKYCIKGD